LPLHTSQLFPSTTLFRSSAMENYSAAETNYKKALERAPDNRSIREALFKVYYQQKNISKAIETAKQLVKADSDYEEDLAQLYLRSEEHTSELQSRFDLVC